MVVAARIPIAIPSGREDFGVPAIQVREGGKKRNVCDTDTWRNKICHLEWLQLAQRIRPVSAFEIPIWGFRIYQFEQRIGWYLEFTPDPRYWMTFQMPPFDIRLRFKLLALWSPWISHWKFIRPTQHSKSQHAFPIFILIAKAKPSDDWRRWRQLDYRGDGIKILLERFPLRNAMAHEHGSSTIQNGWNLTPFDTTFHFLIRASPQAKSFDCSGVGQHKYNTSGKNLRGARRKFRVNTTYISFRQRPTHGTY